MANQDKLQDLLQRVTAAYSETDVQGMLLTCEFQIRTYAENGNPDIVEVPLEVLGHSTEVRELNWAHVQDLMVSDESRWPALEVCLWPEYLPKIDPVVLLRIITGNHRTSAAKEKGLKSLPVRIFKIEKEVDFRTLAVYSNASHGLKFTEDECKRQARYLHQEGNIPYDELVSIFDKSKSTISRWITGNDSNASRKVAKIVQSQQVSGSDAQQSAAKTLIRTVPTVAQKIEALLIGENMFVDAQEAKKYIEAMPAQKKQRIYALRSWMQEATEE